MKVTCRYSGVEFKTQGFGPYSVTSHHPLFDLPLSRLIADIYPLYQRGNLPEPETRIFYAAILKKTGLVIFDHHIAPSLQTIHNTTQKLLETLSWTDKASTFKLPQYRVTAETCTLRNIKTWIREWEAAKLNWLERQNDALERTAFNIREDILKKLIRNGYKSADQYAGRLGRWAVEASNAPNYLRDLWVKIFKLKEPEVYSFRPMDIKELLEHLEENLDAVNNLTARAAIHHIRNIERKNRLGIAYELDDEDEEVAKLIIQKDGSTPFVLLSPYERALKEAMLNAPTEKPEQQNFATKVAYLLALARWNAAQSFATKITQEKLAVEKAASNSLPMEERTLLDEGFDGTEETDYEGTYEDYATKQVEAALAKMVAPTEVKEQEAKDLANDLG